ncbi:alkene reductase [Sorangium sp. So ce269]
MSTSKALFTPLTLGPLTLPNRMVMAPMTRSRAGEGDTPTTLTVTYYAQRATAGLIITEATQISPQGKGYPLTPGIFTDAQVAGWRRVTEAVHAHGGRIFVQLWHVGRVAMQAMQPGHALPVGPSAIRPAGKHFTGEDFVTPRALDLNEIPGVVQQYADAARHAQRAGFDGVEIHAGNGYLLDQFLRDGTNRRTDAYGGSVENRARLLLEVAEAVAGVWGTERVGVRFSPTSLLNDMRDSDPAAIFGHAARRLGELGVGYLHVAEPITKHHPLAAPGQEPVAPRLREAFRGVLMLNGGYDEAAASAAIADGAADLISFGVPFLANPDLVRRYAEDRPLNAPDPSTMYAGGAAGYTDYPSLEELERVSP